MFSSFAVALPKTQAHLNYMCSWFSLCFSGLSAAHGGWPLVLVPRVAAAANGWTTLLISPLALLSRDGAVSGVFLTSFKPLFKGLTSLLLKETPAVELRVWLALDQLLPGHLLLPPCTAGAQETNLVCASAEVGPGLSWRKNILSSFLAFIFCRDRYGTAISSYVRMLGCAKEKKMGRCRLINKVMGWHASMVMIQQVYVLKTPHDHRPLGSDILGPDLHLSTLLPTSTSKPPQISTISWFLLQRLSAHLLLAAANDSWSMESFPVALLNP